MPSLRSTVGPTRHQSTADVRLAARIQVEHTITEEITGIDIVAAQIQIAAGATLPELGLTQEAITKRGFAIQCRVTTEDPANSFAPDTGKIEVYRSAGGNGVRLDASSGFAGAQITVKSFLGRFDFTDSCSAALRLSPCQGLVPWSVRVLRFSSIVDACLSAPSKLLAARCFAPWSSSASVVSRPMCRSSSACCRIPSLSRARLGPP
jgi:hypothetical protein